jgi:branched-chain amino acid transport system substrate-binding protein
MNMPILGGDGWVGDALRNGRDALRNTFISNHYSGQNPDPIVQNFRKNYQAKFNREPDSIAALGYDAAKVLADSIQRAGSTDGPALRDAIATANVAGVTGQLRMNASRNVDKPAVIEELQFVSGDVRYVYRTTINPN